MKYIKHLINTFLHIIGYHISRWEPQYKYLDDELDRVIQRNGKLSFIQIGANDGVTADPLFEYISQHQDQISGIAVEPIPEYFEQLQQNYKNFPQIILKNIAIHTSNSEMQIYRVDSQYLASAPTGAQGIASFDPDFHKKHGTPSEYCITETVACMPLENLLKENSIQHVDLLQIDTEGYDYEILMNIDYDQFKPTLIHFEHGMESHVMSKEQFQKVAVTLNSAGYNIVVHQWDALACRVETLC